MKHGEIRWYKFVNPDKKRPVLILTRDAILEYLGEITVAPIASTIRDIPSEVFLSNADGMPRDCAVNCDHLQTVSKGKSGASDSILMIRHAEIHEAEILTKISFDSKAYWGYPKEFYDIWSNELTISSDYIQNNDVFVFENEKMGCEYRHEYPSTIDNRTTPFLLLKLPDR